MSRSIQGSSVAMLSLVLLLVPGRGGFGQNDKPAIRHRIKEAYPRALLASIERRNRSLAAGLESSPGPGFEFVNEKAVKWPPNSTITVAFLDGNSLLHKAVADVASEWSQHCNLKLDFGLNPATGQYRQWRMTDKTRAADIRVSFDKFGYYSLVGTDSRNPQIGEPGQPDGGRANQRSMNFEGFKDGLPDDFAGVVLHEFGHALGLHHEHQHPTEGCNAEFRWADDHGYVPTRDQFNQFIADALGRRPGIYTVLGGPPNRWPKAVVDHNLRQLTDSHAYTFSSFDKTSIMKYFFENWMFVEGSSSHCFSAGENVSLSAMDKLGIWQAYPTSTMPPPAAGPESTAAPSVTPAELAAQNERKRAEALQRVLNTINDSESDVKEHYRSLQPPLNKPGVEGASRAPQPATSPARSVGSTPLEQKDYILSSEGETELYIDVDKWSRSEIEPDFGKVNPYNLQPRQIDQFKRILETCENKDSLSPQDRWNGAVSTLVLSQSRLQDVEVLHPERWIGKEAMDQLNNNLRMEARIRAEALNKHLLQLSLPLRLNAQRAYLMDEFDNAIEYFDQYAKIIEIAGAAAKAGPLRDEYIRANSMKAAGYLSRANRKEEAGSRLSAIADNLSAFNAVQKISDLLRGDVTTDLRIPSLRIYRDDSGLPRGWIPKVKVRPADYSIEPDGMLNCVKFKTRNSSIQLIKVALIPKSENVQLSWAWKLDEMPKGGQKAGASVNHPLSVCVAFYDKENQKNKVIVLHYVWDPLKQIDDFWQDPEPDVVGDPNSNEYVKTEYPHLVINDVGSPLNQWIEVGPRDIAADFRRFYPDEKVPPIYVIVVQSNCNYGPDDQAHARNATGSIRDLKISERK